MPQNIVTAAMLQGKRVRLIFTQCLKFGEKLCFEATALVIAEARQDQSSEPYGILAKLETSDTLWEIAYIYINMVQIID